MTIELITGHAGSAHVSSADDGWLNVGAFGAGKYVLDTGTQLACTVQSANLVTIGVGDAVFEGRHVRVSVAESVALDNGAQGVSRNDIVCIKYEYDSGTSVETASLAVIKGTASSSTPVDPTIPSGSILDGATTAYMPLWRIPISGISVGTPEKLYGDVLVTLSGLVSKTWDVSQIPNISASKVTSGTFDAGRIPSLDASKITSGAFDAARIPSLNASKITSGTFADGRIPNLNASKVTAGTFGADRIPNLSAGKITTGTLPVARGGTGKTSGTVYVADVLYASNGNNGSFYLSASVANYTMIEIYFIDNDGHSNSTKVYEPNHKTINLSMVESTRNGLVNLKRSEISISENFISPVGYADSDPIGDTVNEVNHIYIYAVVGYR